MTDTDDRHPRAARETRRSTGSNDGKKRSADDNLAPENFASLNDQFYTARPADYFAQRLANLLLAAARGDELEKLMRQGLAVGELTVHPSEDAPPTVGDAAARERYAIADSQILLHHAAETLLRLYLGHESLPGCPWLEIARTRTPGGFKSLLKKRFEGDLAVADRRKRVAEVFHGSASRESLSPVPPEEQWNAANDNVESFLAHFARLAGDETGLYNSAKHGLTILAGQRSMKLGDGSVLSADGAAVSFLEIRREGSEAPRWAMSTSWVEIDRSLALVQVACVLMDVLWTVARARYANHPLKRMRLLTSPPYDGFLPAEGTVINRMQMDLLYYVDRVDPQRM